MAGEFNRLAKHVSVYTVGNLISRGGAFVLIPLYTRHLLPSEFGMLELFYSLTSMITTFVSVGLAHATLRFYFEYEGQDDRNALVSTSVLGSFAVSFGGVLLLSFFTPWIHRTVFASREIGWSLTIVYAGIVLDMMTQVGFAYFRAREYSLKFVIASSARLVTQVTANVYTVLVLKKGVEGILWGNLLAIFMEWCIVTFYVLLECRIRFHAGKFKELFLYSYPFLLSSVVAVVVGNIDRFLLGSFYSLDQVGVYALGLKFGMILSVFVIEPFQRGYGAFRFSIIKQEDAPKIQSQILILLSAGISLVGLVIGLYSKEVLLLIGAHSFADAAFLVPVIMLSISVGSLSYVFQTGILYQKRTKYMFYISSVNSVVSLATNIVGIRLFGMYGAVGAQFVNVTLSVLLTNYLSQKVYPIRFPYSRIVAIFAYSIVCLSTAYFLFHVSTGIAVALKVVVLACFTVLLLKTNVLHREEISLVAEMLRSAKAKVGSLYAVAVQKTT